MRAEGDMDYIRTRQLGLCAWTNSVEHQIEWEVSSLIVN